MLSPKRCLLLALVSAFFAVNGFAVLITIHTGSANNHSIFVAAYDSTPGQAGYVQHDIPGLPDSGTLSQSQGRASSSVNYSLTQYGTGSLFSFDMLFGIAAGQSPYGAVASTNGTIYFSVDTDTTYAISGSLDRSGSPQDFIHPYLSGQLYHPSSSDFDFYQYGNQYLDPLHLGLGSAPYDYETGSLTGILLANELYVFNFSGSLDDRYNTGLSGSAAGTVTLQIGAEYASGVPDSAQTFGLMAVSLAALAFGYRKLHPGR